MTQDSEHTAEKDAAYCPNCGHHITRHPGNVLCFKSEHMRCPLTPEDIRVEAAARAIHAHQEYSTYWDDDQAGSPSRMGTKMRPLSEHGRTFYRGLARAALSAVIPPESRNDV